MNKLWNLENYSAEALHRTVARDGLRIRIHPQVHPFLRREVHTFVRWLRANYPFPIRVNVYIPNTKKIRANDGDLCYGRCFVPYDPDDSITIDVAGGYDYDGDFRALQNYTWGTIFMLAHELGHYYQYLNRVSLTPRGIEWQATYYAHRVQEAYMTQSGTRWTSGRRSVRMSPDGGVLDAKLEKPWYYQGGGMMSSSRIRQEKVPRFFARKLLFPCANPPIML